MGQSMNEAASPLIGADGIHLETCACASCARAVEPVDDGTQQALSGGIATEAGSQAMLYQMADYLRLGYWGNGVGIRHNMGSTGLDPNNGTLYYNVSGYSNLPYGGGSDYDGLTEARRELVRDAFDLYEAVLGINFVETTSTDHSVVDFFFSDNKSGAYAGSPRWSDGTIYYSYINVASSWSGGTSTYDDYTLQTILHEIGHALGLGHQGSYNGSATYQTNAQYTLDSWQATMMSYFSQTENTAVNADFEFLQTPMTVDWLALNDIYYVWGYGTANAFTEDTVWGFNTTVTADVSRIWNQFADYAGRTAHTIVDSGGIDTIDMSGFAADQKLDLRVQQITDTFQYSSDVGGRTGNLTLAIGTVIENAIGGSGNDALIGNYADNELRGGAGDDAIAGAGGNDLIDGGSGFDTAVFYFSISGYVFSALEAAIEVIGEGVDIVLDTVESLSFPDATWDYAALYDYASNVMPEAVGDLFGAAGDRVTRIDVLGNDRDPDGDALNIVAIDGISILPGQTVTLASGARVTLNLDGSLDYDPAGAFDVLTDGQRAVDLFAYTISDDNGALAMAEVEITLATNGADLLVGSSAPDLLVGLAGDDTIEGGGGDDVLSGGEGADTFVFSAGHGQDRITDFDPTRDVVEHLASTGSAVEGWFAADGLDLRFAEGDSVLLEGLGYRDLAAIDVRDGQGNAVSVFSTVFALAFEPVEMSPAFEPPSPRLAGHDPAEDLLV